jgi:hypothetical protein
MRKIREQLEEKSVTELPQLQRNFRQPCMSKEGKQPLTYGNLNNLQFF